jgi:hypothetical protein
MAGFLSVVSGLDWETCRAVIDERVPGGADRALEEADLFFGIDLPAANAAGHLLHIERPEPAAEGLAEFFSRHPCARE